MPLRFGLAWLAGLTVAVIAYSMFDKATAPIESFVVALLAGAVLLPATATTPPVPGSG